jgi:DNA-binding winged helix-turn-helix (wHTH) protein
LSRCIYQLREQLREVCSQNGVKDYNPIETLPKRGYRLLASVEPAPSELRVTGSSLLIELRRRHVLIVGLALFGVTVVGIILLLG